MSEASAKAEGAGFPSRPLDCGLFDVEPGWIDYNGHMNVGYYMLAFDQALDKVFADWLGLDAASVEREGMGPFAMQSSMHYLSELRVGQKFRVSFQLLDCDHKRVHFLSLMHEAESGALSAAMEQISINVDHATRRSAPMPDGLQERFAALMEAHRDLPRPDFLGATIGIRRSS